MFGSPDDLVPMLVGLVLVTALLTALAPSRWRRASLLLWFLFPAFFWFGAVGIEALTTVKASNTLENAWNGFFLLSAFLIVPWIGVFVAGVLIGALTRKFLGPKRRD